MASDRRRRVLVVDDSAVVRCLVFEALAGEPSIEVVGTAIDGRAALDCLETLAPDLVTLDVEMPELDGLATLREIRRRLPCLPVVMFGALTAKGAQTTVAALLAGADDFVNKPVGRGGPEQARAEIRALLVPRILALCAAARSDPEPHASSPGDSTNSTAIARSPLALGDVAAKTRAGTAARPRASEPIDVVAIGVSTGGPAALAELLSATGPDLTVPMLIVQHLPALFTRQLAESLARRTGLDVREAQAGEVLRQGRCLIAPGDHHMLVERTAEGARIVLNQASPVHSCRPSVDVLFHSIAPVFGSRCLALVMTGMGQDGLAGARELHVRGATILAQDEASSVVWGMPGFVAREGLADRVLDVAGLAAEIRRRAQLPSIARSA